MTNYFAIETGPEPPGFSDSDESDSEGAEYIVGPGHSTMVPQIMQGPSSVFESGDASSTVSASSSVPQDNSIKLQVSSASSSDGSDGKEADQTERKS